MSDVGMDLEVYELDRHFSPAERKRIHREQRRNEASILRRDRRKAKWRSLCCFWTWPLRHEFVDGKCVGCEISHSGR